MLTVRIAYEIELVDTAGEWVVWRRGQDGKDTAVRRRFLTRREAEETLEQSKKFDQAAATRLGVKVEWDIKK